MHDFKVGDKALCIKPWSWPIINKGDILNVRKIRSGSWGDYLYLNRWKTLIPEENFIPLRTILEE